MRRATAALLGTLAGTALLVGAKYATPPPAGGSAAGQGGTGQLPSGDPTPADSPSPSPSLPPSPQPSTAPPAAGGGQQPVGTKPAGGGGNGGGGGGGGGTTPTQATCKTVSGNPVTVVQPGIGAVTVTIQACGGVLKSATATISQSNWDKNQPAFAKLNQMAVQYYKTDMSAMTYSGATLTANAYKASLKSAVSKAGL